MNILSLQLFKGRPFVFCVFAATLALLISYFLPIYGKISLLVVCLGAAVFLLCRCKSNNGFFGVDSHLIYALLCIMSSLLIIAGAVNSDLKHAFLKQYENSTVTVSAYAVPLRENCVKITEINGKPCSYYGLLYGVYLPEKYEVFTGDINLTVSKDAYNAGNNISFSAQATEITMQYTRAGGIFEMGNRLNSFCKSVVYKYCQSNAGLISGIFLGNREDIPDSVKSAFSRSGVSHVIAVSGMHIVIALALLGYTCNTFINSKKLRCAILLFAASFYTVLTGCGFSVLRAALMYVFSNSSGIFRAKNDSVTSLFASLYLILLFQPFALFDISLQLSFLATLGIVLFGVPTDNALKPYINKIQSKVLQKALGYVVSSFVMSVPAVIFTIPVVAYSFGNMSLLSPVVTLIISPLVSIILYAAPFMVAFCRIEALGRLFGQVCDTAASLCVDIVQFFSENLNFTVSFEFPFTNAIFALFAGALLLLILLGITKKRTYAVLCALAVVIYSVFSAGYFANNRTRSEIIYACPDGEVLCAVQGNSAYVVDISRTYGNAHTQVFEILNKKGITNLELLVLTHCGEDQADMVKGIDQKFEIKHMLYPENDKYSQKVGIIADSLGIKCQTYNAQKSFKHDIVTITPSFYIKQYRGCTVEINGAVYFSGCGNLSINEEFGKRNSLVIYGKYNQLDKLKFTPIQSAKNVIMSPYIKEELFHKMEFEAYSKGRNITIVDKVCVFDMKKVNNTQ